VLVKDDKLVGGFFIYSLCAASAGRLLLAGVITSKMIETREAEKKTIILS
jgi:hypothetical protein